MTTLNLTYLKYFYDTALHGSMSAAARENFVSQSAVSQGISKLEVALSAKLSTHQRQGFQLTDEGVLVFTEAKRLFSSVSEIRDKLHEMRGLIAGEIRFACTNSLAQFFIPKPYLEMKERFPEVRVNFHRGSLNFIHSALRSGKVDSAIVLDSPEFDCYEKETITRGSFRLYKKAGSEEMNIIVDHVENAEVIELGIRYREHYGKDMIIKDAVSGWALVLTFTEMGHGIGYLPEFITKNCELDEVRWDIPYIQYSICMVRLKGSCLTRAEKEFLKILKDSVPQPG